MTIFFIKYGVRCKLV